MIALRFLALFGIVYLLQGCAAEPVDMVLRPSPEFQPVYPLAADRQKIATGGIYSNRQSDAWFGRGRNYQVGDIITVLLNESTQAARTQNTDVSRESKNSLPTGFNTKLGAISPLLNGIDINNNNNSSKGAGKADQQASLTGSVAVTVVEILANGNLIVRGEKKLGLSEGTEVIQVSGVIRPEDVGPNSTVLSRRLANAQIAYRGSGDLANATKAGWGTSLMHKYWPF
ncbi:MAG: flagellar basal body L-ring protein FlgH [Limnohabitans sp.]|jgi:flagellar L-ring protein precursor FlgH|nr:flagellar basal body L-ring protein FlgH [Limnohabitans sp.]